MLVTLFTSRQIKVYGRRISLQYVNSTKYIVFLFQAEYEYSKFLQA